MITIQLEDVMFDVDYDFTPGERPSFADPGWPEEIDIRSITMEGSKVELLGLFQNNADGLFKRILGEVSNYIYEST